MKYMVRQSFTYRHVEIFSFAYQLLIFRKIQVIDCERICSTEICNQRSAIGNISYKIHRTNLKRPINNLSLFLQRAGTG